LKAKIWTVIVLATVLESTTAFIVWTEPVYYSTDYNPVFNSLEIYAVIIFTFDYFARLFTCPEFKPFLMDALNFIDFLSILPFYIELIVNATDTHLNIASLAAIRIVRLFRVIRILKVSKYTQLSKVLATTLVSTRDATILLLVSIVPIIILYGSAMFYAEQTGTTFDTVNKVWVYPDGTLSGFQCIADGMWFTVVTLCTVGYGDIVPRTLLGRTVGGLTMLSGILVLAMPISIFGAKFNELYRKFQIEKEKASQKVFKKQKTQLLDLTKTKINNETNILVQIEQIKRLRAEQLNLTDSMNTLRDSVEEIRNTYKKMETQYRTINNMVDSILSECETLPRNKTL